MGAVNPDFTFEDFLRERHAELSLYLVTLTANEGYPPSLYGSAEGKELLRQHFLYWWRLEEEGVLVGAGPVNVGRPDQSGLAILKCRSREHAEDLARDEPFQKAGWRTNTVQTWQLNEGLAVDLVRSLS